MKLFSSEQVLKCIQFQIKKAIYQRHDAFNISNGNQGKYSTKMELETYITIYVFETSKFVATDRNVCGSVNRQVELDTRRSNSGKKNPHKLNEI